MPRLDARIYSLLSAHSLSKLLSSSHIRILLASPKSLSSIASLQSACTTMSSELEATRFNSDEAVMKVRRLIGWQGEAFDEVVRCGVKPQNRLKKGEVILFTGHALAGLALPPSSFMLMLLEVFGLQLNHLTPNSIVLIAIFAHLCEMFIGVRPCVKQFRQFFVHRPSGQAKGVVGAYYF